LDKLLLGMAAPLAQTISVPRGEVVPESGPARRPPEPVASAVAEHGVDVPSDARDRLLRVLLNEPGHALDAAADLLNSRDELDDTRRGSRERLAAAVGRLRAAGLTSAQIAELAGFTERDVAGLLAEPAPPSARATGTGPG